jgi:hypothetical protein
MEKEHSSTVLLMVLHVLAKQKVIDPKAFRLDYAAEVAKFKAAFGHPGSASSDAALDFFAELLEHNLPINYNA